MEEETKQCHQPTSTPNKGTRQRAREREVGRVGGYEWWSDRENLSDEVKVSDAVAVCDAVSV